MRSFGGPSRKRKRSHSRSIHETIVMHRKLGTFTRKYTGSQSSILSSAWNANKKLEEEKEEQDQTGNTHRLDDPNDRGPFSN